MMKSRVLSICVLFFVVIAPMFAAIATHHEVCDECERERLSLVSDWSSFPVEMTVEGFDYHGPSKVHTMLSKAEKRIRNLKSNAQKEIQGVKKSVEKQLKKIERDVNHTNHMIVQRAAKEREASLHDAQKKYDNAKLNSFSTMIQIKYNAHKQALELMKEAEKEVVRTIYRSSDDGNMVNGDEREPVVQDVEGRSDYLMRFNEYLSYIGHVISEGEPDEGVRSEMLALCEKQKQSFKESFERSKGEMYPALLSRYALFERICQSHHAAVAPLDEQVNKKVISQDQVKKMKLLLLYDIQQTLALPSNQFLNVPAVLPNEPLESRLIDELNKRLARVEKHLSEQRKKTEEYAAKLAHANTMLHDVDKTHDDFEKLQQKYLNDIELKEREKLEMHIALKRLEDSLTRDQLESKEMQKNRSDQVSAQERDHWGSVIESVKQEKLQCEIQNAASFSEKENLMRNVAELTARIIALQNDLIVQQKEYEKALRDAELKTHYLDRPSLAEEERAREQKVRIDLAQAQLQEQTFLLKKRH